MPRFVLELLNGLRAGRAVDEILQRFWAGFVSGGGTISLLFAAVLVALAYLVAVRIAATGEHRADRFTWFDWLSSAIIAVGGFTIASLASPAFVGAVLIVLAPVAIVYLGVYALQHCLGCGFRSRVNASRLHSRCACGHEHLPFLRHWQAEPFRKHLLVEERSRPASSRLQ